MGNFNVAVIGGGAAGLSAAYFLQGMSQNNGDVVQVDVFEERGRIGGNVDSAYQVQQFAAPFGDLGVNDFNTDTYSLFVMLLKQLSRQGFDVPYTQLTDTTLFFTPEGQQPVVRYTAKELRTSDDPRLVNIRRDWDAFSKGILDELKNPETLKKTVAEFCAEKQYSDDFVNYNLMPRINGMYYTNGVNPGSMSIYAVLKYYALQENIGKKKPPPDKDPNPNPKDKNTRMYFTEGASSWIRALEGCFKKNGGVVHTGANVVLKLNSDPKWTIDGKVYDKIVYALPANRLVEHFGDDVPPTVRQVASDFQYLPSTTFYHNDPSVLPSDRSLWQTYNITIQPAQQTGPRPYVITYVTDLHQGQYAQVPPLVTLDPPNAISGVLEMVDPANPSQKIPATVELEHNTLFPRNIADQQTLATFQGKNNAYYTGGWTVGAGLHEEIIGQSFMIAMMILGRDAEHLHEVHKDHDPAYLPRHLRALIHGEKPDDSLFPQDHPAFRTGAT